MTSEQTMVWPVARDMFGKELNPDHDLYSKAGKGKLHVVTIGHVPSGMTEREEERDGTRSPGAITMRRSIEISRV